MPTKYVRSGFLMSRLVNPVVVHLPGTPTLTVRGRRSGRKITVPLGEPLELEGRRYLVSGRGNTHWVRNLRAAGEGSFRLHGSTMPFRATELHGADQLRIVNEYRARHGRSVDRFFQAIPNPENHPVFRMDPPPPTASAAGL